MNDDLIKRNLAISYASSGLIRRIDGEEWIRISEVKQSLNDVPTVEPFERIGAICNENCGYNPQSKWIPVSERLPNDLEPVNITWINHEPEPYYKEIKDKPLTATGIYFNGQWYWWSTLCADVLAEYSHNYYDIIDKAIEIIAWQPLPEPYKKGGAE